MHNFARFSKNWQYHHQWHQATFPMSTGKAENAVSILHDTSTYRPMRRPVLCRISCHTQGMVLGEQNMQINVEGQLAIALINLPHSHSCAVCCMLVCLIQCSVSLTLSKPSKLGSDSLSNRVIQIHSVPFSSGLMSFHYVTLCNTLNYNQFCIWVGSGIVQLCIVQLCIVRGGRG